MDDNPCTRTLCRSGSCVFNAIGCGFPCDDGKVCNGENGCVSVIPGEGGYCLCDSMCQLGHHCKYTKCTASVCPDGKCEHECGLCDEDCSKDTCKNNRVCDVKLGENCDIVPTDCPCFDRYCDPNHELADERGCYEIECGDSKCEKPFETSGSCCEDCGCDNPDEACNATLHRCIRRCGDGLCEPDECLSCSLDCTPSGCNDTACVPSIGENCRNTEDCVCLPSVTFPNENVEIQEGEEHVFYFDVENGGNITDSYVVDIINGSFGMKNWYKQIKPMEPGDLEQFRVDLIAPYLAGREQEPSDIIIKVRSDQAQELFATKYTITVAPMSIFEYILTKTFFSYIMYIKNIYDALEIVLLPLLGVYLFKTYYFDKKPEGEVQLAPGQQQWGQQPRAYGQAPGRYQAPPGWGQYPQQGQQGGAWQRR